MNNNFKKAIPDSPDQIRIQRLIDSGNRSEFALSLVKQFNKKGTLSEKQWPHVDKLANAKADRETFREKNADVVKWLKENCRNNGFADSLYDQLVNRGSLSDKQVLAVRKNIIRSEGATSSNIVLANVVNVIEALKSDGLHKIAVTVAGYKIYTPESRGDVYYVKIGSTYVGKITLEGKFIPAGAATKVDADNLFIIAKLSADELAAQIIAEGKKNHVCGICSRALTNPVSIEAGIGPVCATRVGF